MHSIEKIKLGLYEKGLPFQLKWEDKFALAKAAGFDFIEFSIDGLLPRIKRLEMKDEEFIAIREMAKSFNMPFETIALTANRYFPLGDPDETIREKGISIVKRTIDIASILEVKIIQVAAYDVNGKDSTEQTVKDACASFVEIANYAKQKNIVIALEVLEDVPFFSSIEKAVKILDELNIDNLKLYADYGNTASIGIDPVKDFEYNQNHIVACHVKDALENVCINVTYGEGIVDFDGCMDYFRKINFNGVFVAEVKSEENLEFIGLLDEINDFIRKKMKDK
ncbi:MAG: L-ribulose-5-phosphate 3-epimerase [Erysipelotrichaceae bacterium]